MALRYTGVIGGNTLGGTRSFSVKSGQASSSPARAMATAAAKQFTGGGTITGGGGGGSTGGGGGVSGSTNVGSNTAFVDAYNKILARLEEGGAGLESALADIEAGKKTAIAAGEQNVVSSGLSGTTIMAGVPLAAEATASRARLAARSDVENKYLTTLSNFANLAFQAEEGRLNRLASAKSQQTAIANRPPTGSSLYVPESERYAGGTGPGVAYGYGTSPVTTVPNAERFPSLYGQGGELPPVPNWMG